MQGYVDMASFKLFGSLTQLGGDSVEHKVGGSVGKLLVPQLNWEVGLWQPRGVVEGFSPLKKVRLIIENFRSP